MKACVRIITLSYLLFCYYYCFFLVYPSHTVASILVVFYVAYFLCHSLSFMFPYVRLRDFVCSLFI